MVPSPLRRINGTSYPRAQRPLLRQQIAVCCLGSNRKRVSNESGFVRALIPPPGDPKTQAFAWPSAKTNSPTARGLNETAFSFPHAQRNATQLSLPQFDDTIPSMSEGGRFESPHRFFDFSGVSRMPLEMYWGMAEDTTMCPPEFTQEGMEAFHLAREFAVFGLASP